MYFLQFRIFRCEINARFLYQESLVWGSFLLPYIDDSNSDTITVSKEPTKTLNIKNIFTSRYQKEKNVKLVASSNFKVHPLKRTASYLDSKDAADIIVRQQISWPKVLDV